MQITRLLTSVARRTRRKWNKKKKRKMNKILMINFLIKLITLRDISKGEILRIRDEFSGKMFWRLIMLVQCIWRKIKLGMLKIRPGKFFYGCLEMTSQFRQNPATSQDSQKNFFSNMDILYTVGKKILSWSKVSLGAWSEN